MRKKLAAPLRDLCRLALSLASAGHLRALLRVPRTRYHLDRACGARAKEKGWGSL